jgi:monoterpene epsilon-lactone hydrolase
MTILKRAGLSAALLMAGLMVLLRVAPAGEQPAVPQANTCVTDADGTEHVTRVVPVPGTISPEARTFLSHVKASDWPTLEVRRAMTDKFRIARSAEAKKLFPVNVEEKTIGGVRCDIIDPLHVPAAKKDRVFINIHGGGFVTDSGSLVEGIPIAYLTQTQVVSVYYRLSPEVVFPAAIDDVVAVYKELLKTHKPQNMAIFGTSAGAILTGEVAVDLKKENLPLPGALGIFSGLADFSQNGDSQDLFTIWGFPGPIDPKDRGPHDPFYIGKTNPRDPVLSPVYADLKGMPPTLFVTSTRDLLLSGTTILHRAFLRAGDDAELVVFEALPHAFWYNYQLPETREALGIMAKFLDEKVGK